MTSIFRDLPNPLPTGGSIGQVLSKLSDEDYDVAWATPTIEGKIAVVTGSSSIDPSQSFTVVNGSADSNQTLPLISSMLIGNVAMVLSILNYNSFNVNVLTSGSDLIMGSSSTIMRGPSTFSLLPTSLGWLLL